MHEPVSKRMQEQAVCFPSNLYSIKVTQKQTSKKKNNLWGQKGKHKNSYSYEGSSKKKSHLKIKKHL